MKSSYLFVALVAGLSFAAESFTDWLCALVICAAAWLPLFLWLSRKAVGIPVFPFYALLHIPYYALAYATGHPAVMSYPVTARAVAACTVSLFLVISTVIWYRISIQRPELPLSYRSLQFTPRTVRFLYALLLGAILFQSGALSHWIDPDGALVGVIRAFLVNGGAVALFCLSLFLGMGYLNWGYKFSFFLLALILFGLQLQSLYLVHVAQLTLLSIVGYVVGSRSIPWRFAVCLLAVLTILQAGKQETRTAYSDGVTAKPPAHELLANWLYTGASNLISPASVTRDEPSIIERASLSQMLLLAQTKAPESVDFLYGSSYLGMPALVIPRVLWPDRPNTSELLVQLNIHFGLLTRDSAESTSIGWGVIAEAYANFGFLGIFLLAAVVGIGLGLVQRHLGSFPALSARGMCCLLIMFVLTAMEGALAQITTSGLQAMIPLIVFSYIVMTPMHTIPQRVSAQRA